MTFGEWVRQERKRKHLSQQELAKMAGLSNVTIHTTEVGKNFPRKVNQRKITAALNAAKDKTVVPDYAVREKREIPVATVVTKGDAIRVMDDEELVFLINCQQPGCQISQNDRDCYRCKLIWLKQKAKGDEA